MQRRKFLRNAGLLGAGALASRLPFVAGAFTNTDVKQWQFSADKKLDPAWVKSLYERGKPTTYLKSKNELRYIGMPVGGILCGCVYVGGDGRLWLWDIFNENQVGAVNKVLPIKLEMFNVNQIDNTFGSLYLQPAYDVRPIQQGFAVTITHEGRTITKRLHEDDWEEIAFEATYPVATIKYIDKNLPVEVSVRAFSPYIPGDAFNSGLPCTIQSITVKNSSASTVTTKLTGWLENKLLLHTGKQKTGYARKNTVLVDPNAKGIILDAISDDPQIRQAADFGNMCFCSTDPKVTCIPDSSKSTGKAQLLTGSFIKTNEDSPVAILSVDHMLKPGESTVADFIISWYTPNISFQNHGPNASMTVENAEQHYYTTRFKNAAEVAQYVAKEHVHLKTQSLLWMENWYNSTLPWWFLERTFANISTLATTTSHRLQSGRFYAWEGVGACHGTCTHVYQYAQAMSRIFPALENDTRERVDLGIAFEESSGMIRIRGEKTGPSIDGQAGTVLRIYREYLMSGDGALLKRNWQKIKKAVRFVMKQDKNSDGMIDTPMENTLDALWSGEISWIVGLGIACFRAGEEMAKDMDDQEFATLCHQYVENGKRNMEQYLFNGEYFIHRPDPAEGKKGVGSYNTCHIDQVYGQAWAWQVGLGRIIDKEKTVSALQALWKYNFMTDVGPYISAHPGGRFYAVAGEGGMVMNTNPKNEDKPYGEAKAWQIGYFSECMSGFEHQVAAHMMAEDMVEESLILTRTIHDRYHAAKRNPFNEIECSDHYARAMASYGSFINACGFTYHGPHGYVGFAPKISPENFKAPFTSAAGWGSYTQQQHSGSFAATLRINHGQLMFKKLSVELDKDHKAGNVRLSLDDKILASHFTQHETSCAIEALNAVEIKEGQQLSLKIS